MAARETSMSDLEYYWKDYVGKIPKDAVKVGTDLAGKSTYIGQAYFLDYGLLTGTIEENCIINVKANGIDCIVETEKCIKILCCSNGCKLTWIKTDIADMFTLTNTHPISGGTYYNYDLYIGRVLYDGRAVVGHVMYNDEYTKGLYLVAGKQLTILLVFELLVYEPRCSGSSAK